MLNARDAKRREMRKASGGAMVALLMFAIAPWIDGTGGWIIFGVGWAAVAAAIIVFVSALIRYRGTSS